MRAGSLTLFALGIHVRVHVVLVHQHFTFTARLFYAAAGRAMRGSILRDCAGPVT